MKNIKRNIFLLAMLAASPMVVNAQTAEEGADTIAAKKKVHVAFSEKDADLILGGVSYVDMQELQKKDYTTGSLDDLYALVGGWNGHNLWGLDNNNLDNNDNSDLPLVIIDGVKRPSNNVQPSEIDQITFLKGAQAVVLYGPKAAKGAILITTKRGTVDGLQIQANVNTGFHVAKEFPEYIGSAEYMTLYNEARLNDGLAEKYTQQEIYNHSTGANPYRYPNVNYYSDEYIRKVYNRSEATLEIQGGGTRAHFYTNVNYYRLEDLLNFGPAKDNYTDRFSVRGNVDLVVNKSIKGFANASATFYNANKNKGDFWGEASTMRPNYPEHAAPLIPIDMVDPNATSVISTLNKSLNLLDGRYFPSGTTQNKTNAIADCYFGGKTTAVSRQFQFDAGIIYDMSFLTKGLSFKTQFAIDYAANYSLSYDNTYAVYIPTWSNYNGRDMIVGVAMEGDEKVTGAMGMSNTAYRQTISWNGHFDYDHTFSGGHHVTGMLLGNMYTTTASGRYHRYTNVNLGLQAGYDYQGKYLADISVAGVHSARLPEGNREALSPSFSIGWNIAKEKFMEGSFVDDLLLSASYSNLNDDADVILGDKEFYIYDAAWANNGPGFSWGDGKGASSTYSTAGVNPILDFIHRKEVSVNLRGSFFNKMINTDISFFSTKMTGYLINNPTNFPSYLMAGNSKFTPIVNHDENTLRGVDFNISANKQFGKVWAQLGIVGTYLWTEKSKVDEKVTEEYRRTEGRPIDAIFGYKCIGYYQQSDFDEEGKLKSGVPGQSLTTTEIQPGDLKYEDINGDGTVNQDDQVYLGKSGSPFMLGLNLTLKYKNFTLFVLGNAQFGGHGLKNNNYYFANGENKYSVFARDRWTPETAEVATHPRLTTKATNNNLASTYWMYSTNRFDLRKIQLTYDFPSEMFEGKVVKGLSLYLNGNDLLTIAKERKHMETNVGYAPQTRFYNLGVKLTF